MGGERMNKLILLCAILLWVGFFMNEIYSYPRYAEKDIGIWIFNENGTEKHWASYEELEELNHPLLECKKPILYPSDAWINYKFSNHPKLKEITIELTKDKESDWEKIKALQDYVSTNITYIETERITPMETLLRTMEGDCSEMSHMFSSMASMLGYETYIVAAKNTGTNNYHAYSIVKFKGYWFSVETTNDDIYSFYDVGNEYESEYIIGKKMNWRC